MPLFPKRKIQALFAFLFVGNEETIPDHLQHNYFLAAPFKEEDGRLWAIILFVFSKATSFQYANDRCAKCHVPSLEERT